MKVDADALRADAGSAEFDHAGVAKATIARRIACDASVMRVVMAGRSEPVDGGRRTKVVRRPDGSLLVEDRAPP